MFQLVFAMLLLDYELVFSFSCEDRKGTCCYHFVWDKVKGKCLPCKPGYNGQNCSTKCPFPYYGTLCTSTCKCSTKDCDYINGCKHLSTSTSTDIVKFVSARTSSNSFCTNNYQSNSTNMKPLLVGIIVLASTAFIIILMTLYAYRLEIRRQKRTKQRDNV